MKTQRNHRLFVFALLLMLAASTLTLPAFAVAGDVSGTVSTIWKNASGQMKTICNNVVFPALSWVCGIAFVISVITAIFNFKKHHTVEVGWPIALLLGLIVAVSAKSWVWTLIGA